MKTIYLESIGRSNCAKCLPLFRVAWSCCWRSLCSMRFLLTLQRQIRSQQLAGFFEPDNIRVSSFSKSSQKGSLLSSSPFSKRKVKLQPTTLRLSTLVDKSMTTTPTPSVFLAVGHGNGQAIKQRLENWKSERIPERDVRSVVTSYPTQSIFQ